MTPSPTRTALCALALLAASLATAPGAAAEECDPDDPNCCKEPDRGFGWEYPNCGFDCDTGDVISVEAYQTYDDYVYGEADCGGGFAACSDVDGRCGQDGSVAGSGSIVGECQGRGYVGFSPGTVTVACYATPKAEVRGAVAAVAPNVPADAELSCPTPGMEPGLGVPHASSLVLMRAAYDGDSTAASGIVVRPGECWNFTPTIILGDVFDDGSWKKEVVLDNEPSGPDDDCTLAVDTCGPTVVVGTLPTGPARYESYGESGWCESDVQAVASVTQGGGASVNLVQPGGPGIVPCATFPDRYAFDECSHADGAWVCGYSFPCGPSDPADSTWSLLVVDVPDPSPGVYGNGWLHYEWAGCDGFHEVVTSAPWTQWQTVVA